MNESIASSGHNMLEEANFNAGISQGAGGKNWKVQANPAVAGLFNKLNRKTVVPHSESD